MNTADPEWDDRRAELCAVLDMHTIINLGLAADIRRRAGVSQGDVARALGCTKGAVSLWESGRRVPRGELGRRYAAVLAQLSQKEGAP
jgi:DNA-binding transcriptional regulator YiaG